MLCNVYVENFQPLNDFNQIRHTKSEPDLFFVYQKSLNERFNLKFKQGFEHKITF